MNKNNNKMGGMCNQVNLKEKNELDLKKSEIKKSKGPIIEKPSLTNKIKCMNGSLNIIVDNNNEPMTNFPQYTIENNQKENNENEDEHKDNFYNDIIDRFDKGNKLYTFKEEGNIFNNNNENKELEEKKEEGNIFDNNNENKENNELEEKKEEGIIFNYTNENKETNKLEEKKEEGNIFNYTNENNETNKLEEKKEEGNFINYTNGNNETNKLEEKKEEGIFFNNNSENIETNELKEKKEEGIIFNNTNENKENNEIEEKKEEKSIKYDNINEYFTPTDNGGLLPDDKFSQKIFENINLIRENPQNFIKMIEDAKKYIIIENNKIKYKSNVKVALIRGEPAFDEAISILKSKSPMKKLIYKPNLTIPLPTTIQEIQDKKYFSNNIRNLTNKGIIVNTFWRDNINDPLTSFILMIVDDYNDKGGKRNDILNPNMKSIGICSTKIDNYFACYLVFSEE